MANKEQHDKAITETRLLVKLFLKTNASDINLGKLSNISSSTVGRRLTNKENILEAFPDNGEEMYDLVTKMRQENLQKGRLIGSQAALFNQLDAAKDTMTNLPALRFDIFFGSEEAQIIFITHMALTFKTDLETLASLLQMETRDLERKISEYRPDANYYFYEMKQAYFNQEDAKKRFVLYYMEMLNAKRNREDESLKVLINDITDAKANDFLKTYQSGQNLSTEDIMTILTYQLKYFISNKKTAEIFGIARTTYLDRVRELTEKSQGLSSKYEFLCDYYFINQRHRNGRG